MLTRTRGGQGGAADRATFTALIPDLHHFRGSFGGRAFPLWADKTAKKANIHATALAVLAARYGNGVSAEDMLAYIAAVAAHPAYLARFSLHLVQPGLRIPVTAETSLFSEAAEVGREVIWLHTFGERFVSSKDGRPASAPRLPEGERPQIPKGGSIPSSADAMPNNIDYDPKTRRLQVGSGYVDNVSPEVFAYEVSGKHVLTQWFSYRGRDRSRPIIGERRQPSPLGDIQPAGLLAEYTTELLNVLNVLGRLVKLEPKQADLLTRICAGPTVSADDFKDAFATTKPAPRKRASNRRNTRQGVLIE